jgi:uncharacterized protein (DUF885 family)
MIATLTVVLLAAAPSDHNALWSMFDEEWDWAAQAFPELASENGDERFNDRLTDWSQAAIEGRKAHEREMLARARAFEKGGLSADDRLNLDLFVYGLQLTVDSFRFPWEELQIDQIDSPPASLAETARSLECRHPKDYENFLARRGRVPTLIDQVTALLKKGLKGGVTPPKVTLVELPKLLAEHTPDDPTQNPLYKAVFAEMPDISPADRDRLRAEAKRVISEEVVPAYKSFTAFILKRYIPGARGTLAASDLPDGKAWYEYDIRAMTTSDMTAEQIHALGLKEVARLDDLMDQLRISSGFQGDRQAFFKFLKTDPRFFYPDEASLVTGYRDIAKRIDPELPKHFGKLPRLTYGVQPMPAYEARTAPAAFYEPGSPETGRAGVFMANTFDLTARPKWAMEDLTLHEAVPGHHLQLALALELGELPRFRRFGRYLAFTDEWRYTAFTEGWALYCESLCQEMELCKDPYSHFGQLSAEMWRAVRLVVDTGIHAKGWTRDQAIRFFSEHTGQSDLNARVEVDRYIIWPGQALAYKIGELDIRRLRHEAETRLGPRFDERGFHDDILAAGSVPLPIMDARFEAWLTKQIGETSAPSR